MHSLFQERKPEGSYTIEEECRLLDEEKYFANTNG